MKVTIPTVATNLLSGAAYGAGFVLAAIVVVAFGLYALLYWVLTGEDLLDATLDT